MTDEQRQGRARSPPAGGFTLVEVLVVIAIVALLALTLGMVVVGFRHFDNIHTGVAASSLFLLLPYIGQMTGKVTLPAHRVGVRYSLSIKPSVIRAA